MWNFKLILKKVRFDFKQVRVYKHMYKKKSSGLFKMDPGKRLRLPLNKLYANTDF